jgi:hypothetical protein
MIAAGVTLVLTPTDCQQRALASSATAIIVSLGVVWTYHVARILSDNVGVDVVEAKVGEPSVQKPDGDGQETSDTQSGGDHLVGLA